MALTRAQSTKASARIAAKASDEDKDVAEDEDEEIVDDENQATDNEDQASDDDTDAGDDDTSAEDDEDDTAEEDDESADDDEDAPKSKGKAKASGEKARISGILRHAEASGRGELAEYLAFETNMSVGAAAKILKAAPKAGASKGKLGAAMSGKNPNIRPGSASAKSEDEKAVAALGWAVKHLNGA